MADLTDVQLAALRIVARSRSGILAAGIGYSLIEDGAVRTDRPRVKAQGAALIAARPMFALERAGLVHFRASKDRRDGFVLTQAGAELLAARESRHD